MAKKSRSNIVRVRYVFISVAAVLMAVLVTMFLFPTTRPGPWNPMSDSYYHKYQESGDTKACVEEWNKYHPDEGIGYEVAPCPDWPQ